MAGKDAYDTFDSGAGIMIPEKDKGNYAHEDANPSDKGVGHADVPEVPQKGR